jgi:hypothetical protein
MPLWIVPGAIFERDSARCFFVSSSRNFFRETTMSRPFFA